jgi:Raf kinase inhibitor-like YbhB/YbcL family protein
MAFALTSPEFEYGEPIPRRFTCEGDDLSPPLEWSGVPAGSRSLALIVEDPDAPDPAAPKRVWVHWVLYDMPMDVSALAEGLGGADLPKGTREGLNDWKKAGYGGPCPSIGRHRYFFRLYALERVLGELKHPTKAQLEVAMKGHVTGQAELMGTYQKSRE